MTKKTTLSDEEMGQREAHSCVLPDTTGLCAFAAPSIQGRSTAIQSRRAEFLIANLELEFELSHRKQSPLKISNRKYFAIFSLNPPHFPAFASSRPNSNIH